MLLMLVGIDCVNMLIRRYTTLFFSLVYISISIITTILNTNPKIRNISYKQKLYVFDCWGGRYIICGEKIFHLRGVDDSTLIAFPEKEIIHLLANVEGEP